MPHEYSDVPVHVRTRVDPETGDEYIVFGVELDGVFFDFATFRGEEFEKVWEDLQSGRVSGS